MEFKSLSEMFQNVTEKFAEKTGYMYKEGQYQSVSFKQAREMVDKIASGLMSLGIKKGDKVALLSENRLEWAMIDYSILTVGAINIPIYPSLLPHQVEYLLNDSESIVVFVSNQDQYDKIKQIKSKCKYLKNIVCMDLESNKNEYFTLDEFKTSGTEYLKKNPTALEDSISNISRDDLATIIYTSGTTGEPKGAMLTHGNFLANIEGSLKLLAVNESDTFLSFLPLCHVFERMAGHFLATSIGATIAYAESIDTVAANMGEVHPTVMTSVPRLYEKIYARVLESVENGPGIKRKIFYWAIGVGKEYIGKIMNKQTIGLGLKQKRNLAYKLVFAKLAERVGGNMRFFISGGAPLSREIAEFFGAAGLMIYEGYGLTETSPVISVNNETNFRFGSVGEILPNIEVKIAEDGEILTRGPHVMKGYFNKEAETKEAIDEENWFHTGDIGFLDENSLLTITDRKKNIIVTSGGKNIAPSAIENKLVTSKFIEQAMVIGDQRKFCSAVIVPAFEPLEEWARENNISYNETGELSSKPEVYELIKKDVESINKDLASYESIKDFILSPRLFTIESNELTPSLKVKRKVVLDNFKTEIEKIYQE